MKFPYKKFEIYYQNKMREQWFLVLSDFFLFCGRSRKLMPSPQPINLKTKANRVVVIHVFPRFEQLLVFSLSPH